MSRQQWGHGYHTGVRDAKKNERAPEGWFFHTRDENGVIAKQGRVVKADAGALWVKYFGWMLGEELPKLHRVSHYEAEGFDFYETDEEMRRQHARENGWSEADVQDQERFIRFLRK